MPQSIMWSNKLSKLVKKCPDAVFSVSDHPMSLGYKALIVFPPHDGKKSKQRLFDHFDELVNPSSAMFIQFPGHRTHVIFMREKSSTLARQVALLTHEISHMVDSLFNNCAVAIVDTEFRAYHIDFFLEKALLKVHPLFEKGLYDT